jgi:hypothetical protein
VAHPFDAALLAPDLSGGLPGALWQFMTARFEWEKTEHGLAARRRL